MKLAFIRILWPSKRLMIHKIISVKQFICKDVMSLKKCTSIFITPSVFVCLLNVAIHTFPKAKRPLWPYLPQADRQTPPPYPPNTPPTKSPWRQAKRFNHINSLSLPPQAQTHTATRGKAKVPSIMYLLWLFWMTGTVLHLKFYC